MKRVLFFASQFSFDERNRKDIFKSKHYKYMHANFKMVHEGF